MAKGDRTGPLGQGPMTGRGAGYCRGFGIPGYMNPALVRGFRFGRGWRCFRGFGRRFRWFWRTTPFFAEAFSKEDVELLKEEAEILKRELEAVQKRLSEIEKGETK